MGEKAQQVPDNHETLTFQYIDRIATRLGTDALRGFIDRGRASRVDGSQPLLDDWTRLIFAQEIDGRDTYGDQPLVEISEYDSLAPVIDMSAYRKI